VIGTLVNQRYRLDAQIGQGGMGVVYRAHDTLLDRDVALKVLSATALSADHRARLLREAQAAAQLNHPNVVTVYDAGEVDPESVKGPVTPFIVMELVEGTSLGDGRPEALADILVVARQVCDALEHAHAHGIVHRDLKPENIMLTRSTLPSPSEGEGLGGKVKLVDFGLARTPASRLTAEGTIVGTVFYLAPEQVLGEAIDHRVDLYALGVMLYELTTGQLPFTGDDPLAIISQHLQAPVVPPRARNPEIPPPLDALIVRLLNKSPERRPASAAEVRETLERLASGADAPAATLEVSRDLSLLDRIARGRMVGRERELAQARALWVKAASGEGQVLLVSGEPGIGKTRLVRELVTQVQVSGGRALLGAGYAEGGMPYAPFAQMLRSALEDTSSDGLDLPDPVLADLLTLAPELGLHYPGVKPNPAPGDPRSEQYRLFENTLIYITALSNRAPLLLVLEDAHWVDSNTLSLLRHLARHTRRQRVMIVATYREVELDAARPLHEMLLDLQRERLATRMKLPRLDREGTRELLEVLFAQEITPEGVDGVWRETEGNPFYIEEVCKALVESGKLYYQDGRWQRPSIKELGIPKSVRVAIQSRVRKLPADAQETLRLAAVLGREFDLEVLAGASELDEDALFEALEDAERAQLIEEVSGERGARYAFVHALFASTLVEGTRTLQRRRLHRRAAVAIKTRHPDDCEALAYHYSQAGQAEQAANYLLKAGDRALGLYAHAEARQHYAQALEALARLPDTEDNRRRRVDTLIVQIITSWRADSPECNLARLTEAERLVVELPGPGGTPGSDRQRLVRVHFWMGRVHYMRGAYRECVRYYQQVVQESGDAELIAISSSAIGQVTVLQGRLGKAEALLGQTIPTFEQMGNGSEWFRALVYYGTFLAIMGDYTEALAEIQRARAWAQEMNALIELIQINAVFAIAHIQGGDLSRAIEAARKTTEMAAQSGETVFVYLGHVLQSWATGRAGQYKAAAACAAKAQALMQELGGRLLTSDWFAAANAETAYSAGRVQETIALAERAVDVAQEMGGIFAEGLARRAWGQALAALVPPRWDEAEDQLAESLRLLESGSARLEAARTHVAWGAVCRDRGNIGAAREHWEHAAAQWEASGLTDELERTRAFIEGLA
jgi:tetratricopeptide (TPR) repeat protein